MSQPDSEIPASRRSEKIRQLSSELLGLAPGPLAELRRMEIGGSGTPAFWRLAAKVAFLDEDIDAWMQIARVMAILVPKGDLTGKERLHQFRDEAGRKRGLGTVLCDGGDPDWPPKDASVHDGVLSEKRLVRFLALPAIARGPALERIARMLATRRSPYSGVNCVEIANLLLDPDNRDHARGVAGEYYRRLDGAVRAGQKGETEE